MNITGISEMISKTTNVDPPVTQPAGFPEQSGCGK